MRHTNKYILMLLCGLLAAALMIPAMAEAAREPMTVAPMDVEVDPADPGDGDYPAAFEPDSIVTTDDGIELRDVTLYTQDWYDIVDIHMLAPGDTLIVEGEAVPVESVERDERGVVVNGGFDAGGYDFYSIEDTNGFTIRMDDDYATYTDHGEATLKLSPDATFTDGWDITKAPVTVEYADIPAAIANSENPTFTNTNTTIVVENGQIVSIERIFNP